MGWASKIHCVTKKAFGKAHYLGADGRPICILWTNSFSCEWGPIRDGAERCSLCRKALAGTKKVA